MAYKIFEYLFCLGATSPSTKANRTRIITDMGAKRRH